MKDRYKPIFKAIGNNIQMSRQMKGLSLEEIANKSSLSMAELSKVENGEIDLKFNALVQIAEVLEVDVKSLMVDNLK